MDSRTRIGVAALVLALLVGPAADVSGIGRQGRVTAEIAFSCDGDICLIDSDGRNRRRLTHDRWINSYPAWSPDGRRIAFSGVLLRNAIFEMNADGSARRRVTPRGADDAFAAWSPDGRTIAFDDNSSETIWLMDTDGSTRHRLTQSPSSLPSWSPDGTRIAFVASGGRRMALTSGDIRVTDAMGRHVRTIATDGSFPAWSPDGTRIAFLRNTRGTDTELWMMAADGSRQHRVLAHSAQGGGLSWSPDGARIAFTLNGEIYVVDAYGHNRQQLTHGCCDNLNPAWQP